MERGDVVRWVEGYEQAWRSAGVESLAELFSPDATYSPSPWRTPLEGLDAIGTFWEAGRDGAEEAFDMTYDLVAVEGDTAVVRLAVKYGTGHRWRDLWILRFGPDGRCVAYEEWPFSPRQRDGHEDIWPAD